MENIVDAFTITNVKIKEPSTAEKVFVLICRFWPEGSKGESEDGQVYFVLTSAEKDKIFRNVMEHLRKAKTES